MRTRSVLILCVLTVVMCQSCRMADVLAGNERAGTVDRLWPDIPSVAGARKSDLAVPLAARLIIRTLTAGRVNFIAFTTNRTAQEVKDFYTVERMRAAGWVAGEEGCIGDAGSGPNQGAVCIFIRPNDHRENALAIVVAEDTEKGETHIFYARFDGIPVEELRREQERPSSRN